MEVQDILHETRYSRKTTILPFSLLSSDRDIFVEVSTRRESYCKFLFNTDLYDEKVDFKICKTPMSILYHCL